MIKWIVIEEGSMSKFREIIIKAVLKKDVRIQSHA